MGSKSSLGRIDWPQLLLVILAIIGLMVAASMAAGFAGEETPGEGLFEGLLEGSEPPPGEDGFDEPTPEDTGEPPDDEENGDDPGPAESEDQDDENGDEWDPEDSIIAADDEVSIDHGEFSEPSEEVVFEVFAEQPAYWRISAYDSYTGQSWQRSDDIDRIEEIEAPQHREELTHEIVPKVDMQSVPAAWQPVDFGGVDQDPYLDQMNGLRVDEPVAPSESGHPQFGVFSLLPVTDEALLNNAGTDYPGHVEAHYLQQPDEVPDRVTEKTDDITAEAETPYEKAAIIAYWLRTNNNYSLDVPPPEGEITDEVLFERDEAYCTYFATAMTTMLRTQDIPARYVTGYGPGEFHEGENRAVVRAMNAHAWVEVYFPGYGWVPFEPTPPDDRSDAIEEATDEGEDSLESGDPSDEASLEGTIESIEGLELDDLDESVGFEDPEDDDIPDGYHVELPDEIVPGQTITATVTRHGDPVPEAVVQFNGETIGETDESGAVSGEVPFVSELNVTVIPPGESAGATVSAGSAGGLPGATGMTDSVNRTVPTDGDFNITIEAIAIPDKEVPLLVTIENYSVPEAEISIDGEYVGTTDQDGYSTITLPSQADDINVTAERGELAGTKPVELHPISLNFEDPPLAGSTIPITVAVGDAPLSDAEVVMDSSEIGSTNTSGGIGVPMPDEPRESTVSVTYRGVYEEMEFDVVTLSVDIDERPMAGKTVTVNATAGVDPLEAASISVDDTHVGETDADGTLTTNLPDSPGTVRVELDYEGFETNSEFDVKSLELEQRDDFSFPLKTSEFEVTWDDEPVSNATIAFSGSDMGTTDGDGLFSARVPITTELVVLADMNGATAETTIDGLLYKIGAVLVLPLVLLGGISYWQRQRLAKPARYVQGIGHRIAQIIARIPQRGLDLLVQLGRWLDRVRARGKLALLDCWHWVQRRILEMRVLIPRYVALLRAAIISFDLETLRAVVRRLIAGIKRRNERTSAMIQSRDEDTHSDSNERAEQRERTIMLRMVWDRFIGVVRPPGLRTKTPGEIKRYAISRGFPRKPVEKIVELFRSVEYGKKAPTAQDITQAEKALETTQRDPEH